MLFVNAFKTPKLLHVSLHNVDSSRWELERRLGGGGLRTFVALVEGLGLVPSTHIKKHTTACNSKSRQYDTLFLPLQTAAHTCT